MTRRLRRYARVGSLLLPIFIAVVAAGALAPGAAAQTTVEDCTAITEPGRYVLAGNVSSPGADACLRIRASDVDLDGERNAVVGNGSGSGTVGILVEPSADGALENVTVANVTTAGWDTGVSLRGAVATGAVRNVTAANNRDGVVLDPEYEFRAADGTVSLDGTRALNNERWGVALRPGADADRLTDTVARNNDAGVVAVDVTNLSLTDTHATNNTAGVQLGDASGATLRNTTVTENARAGLWAGNGFDDARLVDTVARSNGGSGVTLGPANNVTMGNATAAENDGSGLVVRDASSIRVRRLTVTGNGRWGLSFDGVSDTHLGTLTAAGNRAGLYTGTNSENVSVDALERP